MIRILVALIAILFAASVAYVWVAPEGRDTAAGEGPSSAASAQPAKDDSRIVTPAATARDEGDPGDMPVVGAVDIADLPFEPGCGLHLRRDGEEEIVFVDVTPDEAAGGMPAAMVIDGTRLTLSRTTADGEPIGFGQYPRQVFDSADRTVRVVVEVDFGEETDPDDIPVSAGELTVMKSGRPTLKFPVSGGAGCG